MTKVSFSNVIADAFSAEQMQDISKADYNNLLSILDIKSKYIEFVNNAECMHLLIVHDARNNKYEIVSVYISANLEHYQVTLVDTCDTLSDAYNELHNSLQLLLSECDN